MLLCLFIIIQMICLKDDVCVRSYAFAFKRRMRRLILACTTQ